MTNGLLSTISKIKELVAAHPIASTAGVGSVAALAGVGAVAAVKRSRSKTRKRKKSYSKSRRKGNHKRVRRTPHTAGKGKDRSHRRIRYTKNGQPYVIMRSGKAKFIKKRGARASHRRKGGRY